MINVHAGMKGFYRLEVRRPDGTVRETGVAPEFPNLILDSGLDLYGQQSGWLGTCRVGAGSTPPAVTDTNLESQISTTTDIVTESGGNSGVSPYYVFQVNTYRFAEGTAAGNISEVGVGSSTILFSRALVLDSGGTPTSITVLPDEVLDVTYELRYYIEETDDTGTITFTGGIGGTYDYIFRASEADNSANWAINKDGEKGIIASFIANITGSWRFYTGDIGQITGSPSGSYVDSADSVTPSAYVNGSYEQNFTVGLNLTSGNDPAGLRSLTGTMGMGFYQLQFDPAIPKTSDDTLSMVVKHTWGRA